MITRRFVIRNKSGLHVRSASVLASGLSGFQSSAHLRFGGREYNAKSPVHLLSACVKNGDTIYLRIDGPDEQDAAACAAALIESGLGE